MADTMKLPTSVFAASVDVAWNAVLLWARQLCCCETTRNRTASASTASAYSVPQACPGSRDALDCECDMNAKLRERFVVCDATRIAITRHIVAHDTKRCRAHHSTPRLTLWEKNERHDGHLVVNAIHVIPFLLSFVQYIQCERQRGSHSNTANMDLIFGRV